MQKQPLTPEQTAAIHCVLEQNRGRILELIIRLLWDAGISPKEMQPLTWHDVDFPARELALPDRRVPLVPELCACLEARHARWQAARIWPDALIITDQRRSRMHHISIYRTFRAALDAAGLPDLQPSDLQDDYIIRLLAANDWPYVVKASGISIRTLYTNYSPYLPARLKTPRAEVDEARLLNLLTAEGPTPAGLALWMTWQLGMNLREIAELTWADVDLDAGCLFLPDRAVPLDETLSAWLRGLSASRTPEEGGHVLLTPRSRRPFGPERLSVVARQALIRGGMEELSTDALLRRGRARRRDDRAAAVIRLAEQRGSIGRNEVMEFLGLTKAPAYALLRRLADEGQLVLIGARYYPAGAVEPPENHYAVIRGYLEREGGAYRKELSDLLRVEPRSCTWILHNLVERGLLRKDGQRYYLPEGS